MILLMDEALQAPYDAIGVACEVMRPRAAQPRAMLFGVVELDSAPNGMALTLRLGRLLPSLTARVYFQSARAFSDGWNVYWHIPKVDIGLVLVW